MAFILCRHLTFIKCQLWGIASSAYTCSPGLAAPNRSLHNGDVYTIFKMRMELKEDVVGFLKIMCKFLEVISKHEKF